MNVCPSEKDLKQEKNDWIMVCFELFGQSEFIDTPDFHHKSCMCTRAA